MKMTLTILLLIILSSCTKTIEKESKTKMNKVSYDSHVHIMSPYLINYWKKIGIPFSKSEVNYSNIDTILKNNQTQKIDLIGMGYVYGNPEYYQGEDRFLRMQEENNYLLKVSNKFPKRIKPYFAIDPLKDYALTELERCVKMNKESGLKLHFSTSQVYLTEPEHLKKIKSIFSKSAEYGLSILLHFDNWHPKFGKRDIEILIDSVLTNIPAIELQIAHFGTSGGFNEKTKHFIDSFIMLKNQNRIPTRHKIYFDISAVALDKDSEGVSKLTEEEFKELRKYIDKIGIKNIVFGTDYPLYKSKEYIKILKEKVGFSEYEIKTIMK